MSYEPSKPTEAPSDEGAPKRRPFETWRKIALVGAVLLLGNSLVRALIGDDMPDWLYMALNSAGYVILAVAFGTFFRQRRSAQEERDKKYFGL